MKVRYLVWLQEYSSGSILNLTFIDLAFELFAMLPLDSEKICPSLKLSLTACNFGPKPFFSLSTHESLKDSNLIASYTCLCFNLANNVMPIQEASIAM